uniref:Paramyosin n=1 Tax=Parascaris univalens TaxID=6257 RepID=A0A915A333_PARUN
DLKALESNIASELQQKECVLREREAEAKRLDMD